MDRLIAAGTAILGLGALASAQPQPGAADQSSGSALIGGPDVARPADYPAEAVRQKSEGQVWFELDIDDRGRIIACTIKASSGHASLDRAACDVYRRRARFKPALDTGGRARTTKSQHALIWRLGAAGPEAVDIDGPDIINSWTLIRAEDYPKEAIRKLETGTVVARLQVDAVGRPLSCAIAESSGSASLDSATCALLSSRSRFNPARDELGRAVAGERWEKIGWLLVQELTDHFVRSVVRYGAAGKVAGCEAVLRIPDQPPQTPPCTEEVKADAAPGMVDEVANGRAEWIVEHLLIVEEGSLEPLPPPGPGDLVVREFHLKVILDAQGMATGCTMIILVGDPGEPCSNWAPAIAPVRIAGKVGAATVSIHRRDYLRYADPSHAGPRLTNLSELITEHDYPVEAVDAEQEGRVGIRVQVDPQGRVSSCTVASSSGSPSLDKASCALVTERARYQPARDAQGRGKASIERRTINWRLEGADFPFAEWIDRMIITSAPVSCRREFEGALAGESVDCTSEMPKLAKPPPGSTMPEASARMVIESRFLPRELRPGDTGESDPRTLVRQVLNLTIAADGKLVSCELAEPSIPGYSHEDACSFAKGTYDVPAPPPGAQGVNRPATLIITIKIEAERVT